VPALDWTLAGHFSCPGRERALIKIIVVTTLVLIVASLASALYYLYHDRGRRTRMVTALAIRVALSASLLIFLVVSYKLGWIGARGLR
jgi:heme/copper-type cytochrome/quinol oxidase subunit 3